MTFIEAYNKYLDYSNLILKSETILCRKNTFEHLIVPFFKDYNIDDVNENIYVMWQYEINKHNYSNNYKKRIFYEFSAFYNYLIKFNIVSINIPKKVGPFKYDNLKVEHNIYSFKEFRKFIKCFDNIVYRTFFELLFYTGIRPGEAMALKFSDLINSNNFYIKIDKTITEHSFNGSRLVLSPKTMSSNRKILITKKIYIKLLYLNKHYFDIYNKNIDFYIFGGIKPLAPVTINRYKNIACAKCGLKPIKLHEFRHSHASLLYKKKIDILTIKERLGHGNISTTMDTYVHNDFNNQKKVCKTLNFFRLFF